MYKITVIENAEELIKQLNSRKNFSTKDDIKEVTIAWTDGGFTLSADDKRFDITRVNVHELLGLILNNVGIIYQAYKPAEMEGDVSIP